jgi:hypothetical protein
VRQLVSKLIAGGLSAGVVLLWWPQFFPTDTATSWLGRGVVWTLAFELLLIALSPLELALWTTEPGTRLTEKVSAARGLFEHPSPRRRMSRRAAVAVVAMAVPVMLIGAGVHAHIPVGHRTAANVTNVTKVVRVVRPVEVKRVVKTRTIRQQVPMAMAQAPAQRTVTPTKAKSKAKPQHKKTMSNATPKSNLRPLAPVSQPTPAPTGATGPQTAAG